MAFSLRSSRQKKALYRDENLSYRNIAAGKYSQDDAGIGIFDDESLEAIYLGTNLSMAQLDTITDADASTF